jgi:hypothetical protein
MISPIEIYMPAFMRVHLLITFNYLSMAERSSHTASSASTHDSDDAGGVFSSTDSSSRTSRDDDRENRKKGGRKILFKGKW